MLFEEKSVNMFCVSQNIDVWLIKNPIKTVSAKQNKQNSFNFIVFLMFLKLMNYGIRDRDSNNIPIYILFNWKIIMYKIKSRT